MSSCNATKEMLVLHAEGALEPEESRRIDEHLSGCPDCRAEAAQIARIRGWLAEPELFEPAQDLSWELLPRKIADRAGAQDRKRGLSGMRSPIWALSAAALVVLAAGLIWTVRLYPPAPPAPKPAQAAAGNEAFLNKMRTAHAREATAQYIAGCQDLLLDLVSSEKKCEGNLYDVSLEVTRARQLLQEKRLLDAGLRLPEVERARNLCDELERFLTGLSTSQDCETFEAIQSMERVIEKEQLLLRINLVQSGIS